jgi:hypothetical protein
LRAAAKQSSVSFLDCHGAEAPRNDGLSSVKLLLSPFSDRRLDWLYLILNRGSFQTITEHRNITAPFYPFPAGSISDQKLLPMTRGLIPHEVEGARRFFGTNRARSRISNKGFPASLLEFIKSHYAEGDHGLMENPDIVLHVSTVVLLLAAAAALVLLIRWLTKRAR